MWAELRCIVRLLCISVCGWMWPSLAPFNSPTVTWCNQLSLGNIRILKPLALSQQGKGFLLISKVQYHEEEEDKDAKEEEVKEEDEVKRIKR